ADGERVLTFAQAQRKARGPRISSDSLTVAEAVAYYLRFLEADGRSPQSVYDARKRCAVFVEPALGRLKIAALTPDRLRRWRDDLAGAAPRLRTRSGEEQKYREAESSDDGKRARRATANRTWTTLRAALNHAFNEGKVETDIAWRKVKPYRAVDAARIRYL